MEPSAAKPLPQKLKHDAIVEALLEVRFETGSVLPEVLVGRLADHEPWKAFRVRRLPAGEIPDQIRSADPNLRHQPSIELVDPARKRLVRIGERVLSYHQLAPYVGWNAFRPELFLAVDRLFLATVAPTVTRLGLRYVNAFQPAVHGIQAVTDLDLQIRVAGESSPSRINLNFATDVDANTSCTVRIATSDFIGGTLPPGTTVVIDVDVFSRDAFRPTNVASVKEWIEFAHTKEKENFFRLLTLERINALKEN